MDYHTPHDDQSRIMQALGEVQALIQRRYPTASFFITEGEDPVGMYLTATVDVDDTDEVVDVFIDRLLELQVDERLPIYVLPVRPIERVLHDLRTPRSVRPRADLGHRTPYLPT